MRDYGKISPKFWTGTTGKEIKKRGFEATVVALYLTTSPHSNMLGLYYQPILYMAHETGLGLEGAYKGLHGCIDSGFCAYDERTEMVWVFEMAKYQIANELKASDKRSTGIQKDYDALQGCPFLGDFFDKYETAFHLKNRRENEGENQAPSKPHRSQEQEQEQEQDISAEQFSLEGACPETPAEPSIETLPLADKSDHPVFQGDVDAWQEAFPGVSVISELKKMKVWLDANPRKRKTGRGINAFIVSWLGRQQDRPSPGRPQFDDDYGGLA